MKPRIVGIDGEGITRPDGSHDYAYLAAVREDGKLITDAWNKNGLSHAQCLKVLLSVPRGSLCFTFGSSYDATKIFEGIERRGKYNEGLDKFFIFHPEARRVYTCLSCSHQWRARRAVCPKCRSGRIRTCTPLHRFKGRGYTADVHGFTVAEGRHIKNGAVEWKKTVRVWDAFGFTHRPFDESLEMLDLAQKCWLSIKEAKRNTIGLGREELTQLCQAKAEATAQMMRKILDNIHVDLKGQYRGAGSIAGALLRQHNVAKYRGRSQGEIAETNPELARAIMCAYHSGRTEISQQGMVEGPLYEYDITAAYPWAMSKLPCLKCGHWRKATQGRWEMHVATLAVAHFRVRWVPPIVSDAWDVKWSPLPCRTGDGSVWGTNFEGWAWWPEVEAAMNNWPGLVEVLGGLAYHTNCKHKPFAFIEEEVKRRRAEKDIGMSQIRKQAQAAIYGKVAQRIDSPMQSYIWAGLTTARIRARVLDELARNPDAVSVATDAIVLRRRMHDADPSSFGGWRLVHVAPRAYFAAPGLYFDEPPPGLRKGKIVTSEREFCNGRRSVVAMIQCKCGESWDFARGFTCPACGGLGGAPRASYVTDNGARVYGRWVKSRQEISTAPGPKREAGPHGRLLVRDLGGVTSLPYEPKKD